jgi:uncharacterized membrane protein
MFERKKFKNAALIQLKGRMKTPVFATLISLAVAILFMDIFYPDHHAERTPVILLLQAFSLGTILIAYTKIFIALHNSAEKIPFAKFIDGFSSFASGTLGLLWFELWTTLWSFLFVIPGIVKSFSYSQMFFVIAENPKIKVTRAMNISKKLTQNHKAELFALSLSFLGWNILSIFTLGILQFWIIPYETMTFTNAYFYLKEEAFKTGVLTPADFLRGES